MEAEARELERIAKCRAENSWLALWIDEEKVYKYRVALIMSWIVLGVYFCIFYCIWGPWTDAMFAMFDTVSMPCFIKLYI
ncbi:hypothetical protein CFP56_005920 [Quercus suber]|uniref:Uncharacterized protein n=1 Tax=Quercus suber TaxID=58331 RepID=A0AAW0M8C7_QUESU